MDKNKYLMESGDEAIRLELKTNTAVVEGQGRWAGIKPGMRIADIGCGPGLTTSILHKYNQPGGQTVNQGLVPNSWLFDASGNLVWLSEEDLKQYELAQLVKAESIGQVDETDTQMIGISTSLLNQIGWYSVGAGAAAGAGGCRRPG